MAVDRPVEVASAAHGVPWRRDRLDVAEEHMAVPKGDVRRDSCLPLDRRRVAGMADQGRAETALDRIDGARHLVPVGEEYLADTSEFLDAIVVGAVVHLPDRFASRVVE
jgi:hypothetical protein